MMAGDEQWPNQKTSGDEMVVTPGGRLPRRKVHLSYTLTGGPMDEFVITPGGRRHRRHVHRIRAGEKASFQERTGFRLRQRDEPGPPDSANWITSAGWMNTTGRPITRFATTWTVPPAPALEASQLIYLFNGIEPSDGQAILQPVLQWGDSGTDKDGQNRTGPFWTAASWLVGGPDGSAIHTPHVRVNSGDVLVGVITLTAQSGAGFEYACEFEGLAGTSMTTQPISELAWCVETLEAYELQGNQAPPYDLNDAAEYPLSNSVTFSSIDIVTNAANPNGLWQSQDVVTQFGEHTEIAANTSTNGRVLIWFRRPAAPGV
jgi:hypothetical protein